MMLCIAGVLSFDFCNNYDCSTSPVINVLENKSVNFFQNGSQLTQWNQLTLLGCELKIAALRANNGSVMPMTL